MIKVLVADDEALLRTAFSSLIDAEDNLEVVDAAANGRQAVELAVNLAPDVVVMDVRMPVMDGIEATGRITRDRPGCHVLILTTFDLDEYVFEALRAGASGFALKSRSPEELLSGIRTLAAGEALLAPSVTRRLIAHFADRIRATAMAPRGLDELTEREREVLSLVGQGLSNAELAAIGMRIRGSANVTPTTEEMAPAVCRITAASPRAVSALSQVRPPQVIGSRRQLHPGVSRKVSSDYSGGQWARSA